MKVLGVDPGLNVTGFGIVECAGGRAKVIEAGTIEPNAKAPFAERIAWAQRTSRDAVIAEHAQRYASRLEHYLRLAPLQWFNFYRFWRH